MRKTLLGAVIGVIFTFSFGAIILFGDLSAQLTAAVIGFVLAGTGIVIGEWLESWAGPSKPIQFIGIVAFSTVAYLVVRGRLAWAVSLLFGASVATGLTFVIIETLTKRLD